MKNRKLLKIVSIVSCAILFFAGCSNSLVENGTVSGVSGESRVASVTITNFASNVTARTIAPEQPDLTSGFVFVATGSSARKTMTPGVVEIDTNGRVDLSGLDAGIWTLTITAYDSNLLGNASVDVTDANAIITSDTAVLSGSATVDLTRGNGNVEITLTPKGMGTNGSVDLVVDFDDEDITAITAGGHTVTIGLYEKLTNVEINDSTPATTVKTVTASNITDYEVSAVAKGEYLFKVIITANDGTGPWYYTDNIYIEGNRTTSGTINLPKIIGEKPAAPENFAVYWDENKADASTEKYTAHFAWDRKSYNEDSYELQILDITDKYSYDTAIKYDGAEVANVTALWAAIDDEQTAVFTKDNFASTEYPIYDKTGSLLAGSTSIDYELRTGRIYVARVRSVNTNGKSDWVNIGTVAPTSAWTAPANQFDSFVLDVYNVIYDLTGYMLLKDSENVAVALKNKQPKFVEYVPGTSHEIDFKIYDGAVVDSYLLYKDSFTGEADASDDIHEAAWKGWMNTANKTEIFDNTTGISGFSNIVVTPCGINGANLSVITSGTYAKLLTTNNVLVSVAGDTTTPTWSTNAGIANAITDVSEAVAGVGVVDGIFAVNLVDGDTTYLHVSVGEEVDPDGDGTPTFTAGSLTDESGRVFEVLSVTYSLEKSGSTFKQSVTGTPNAYIDLTGSSDGDYILRVEAKTSTGYIFTFQTPFIIKYTDTTL